MREDGLESKEGDLYVWKEDILSTFSIALTSVLGVLVYRLNRQYADRKEDEKRHLEKAQEDEKKRMEEYAALKDGLLAILRDRIIQADVHCSLKEGATVREKTNVQMMYASYLRQMISMGLRDVPGYLKGMHIVVDAGNGSAGFFATEVLAKMGADISGSQFLEPDGTFPNHPANPENKEALEAICRAVKENGADLGIIFDTDGDRVSAVGPGGIPIARNEIVALAAALAVEDHPGGTVVTDSVTSNQLHDFLEGNLGFRHLRYQRGYKNVINKAKELSAAGEDAFLAIETSGHAAYSDNYYMDDGAFLAIQIIINAARLKAEGKDITALLDGLGSPAESREVRFDITAEDYAKYGAGVLEDFAKWAEYSRNLEVVEPNYEGVRVKYDIDGCKGWFLLRMSLHDPVMPLNIESDMEGGTEKALDAVRGFMKGYKGISEPGA